MAMGVMEDAKHWNAQRTCNGGALSTHSLTSESRGLTYSQAFESPFLEVFMRTLVKVSIPVEAGNAAIKDGSLPKIFSDAIDRLKPEAAYFAAQGGVRTAFFVLDLKDPTDIPV